MITINTFKKMNAIYFKYIIAYNSYSMYNDMLKKNYFINVLNKRDEYYLELTKRIFYNQIRFFNEFYYSLL